MPQIDTLAKKAAALAFGLTLCTVPWTAPAALADDSHILDGVQSMEVLAHPPGPQVVVRNVAGAHDLGSLDLAIQGNTVAVSVGAAIDCTGTESNTIAIRSGHALRGGAFGIGRSSFVLAQALPDPQSIDHTSDMDAHVFQLPIAKLANPQIDVDPVAVVLAAAEKAPNKVQWLRQDHTLSVKIPLRLEAVCAPYERDKLGKKETIWESIDSGSVSYLTRDVELTIKYEGDPQLFAVNAQVAQGGLPNQVQVGDQPFKVTAMSFQPNMPHHVGACPATTKIRVYFQGQGKGEVRIRINEGGTTIHDSPKLPFDSQNGKHHYDFEIATPKAAQSDLNKTFNHDLRVYVRGKGANDATWPAIYQPMDQALWKHRCTPIVNPVLGGNTGGKVGGYQNGGDAKPARAPLKVLPPAGTPARPARQSIQ